MGFFVDKSIKVKDVANTLDQIAKITKYPKKIKVDNGSEFIFRALYDAENKIEIWRKDYNEFRPYSRLTYLTPLRLPQLR